MSKMTVTIDVFSTDKTTYNEDGEPIATGDLEGAIIAAAAEKLLSIDVPDESKRGYHRGNRLRALLEERIEKAVAERIKEVTLDEVDKAVRAAITEGWQKTDEWGEPTGKTVTLKQRINDILNGKSNNYHNETRLQQVSRETIENALQTVFKEEIEKARVAFRAQIDGVLQAKLREQLAGALGLKA